ncbi:MAG: DNA polymerase ligase N-terminal domain-containing protein [Pirellulales bacterium]|nr:DNA polymerase ligase N-terminal domain-containing protein [Pirellulales bacterium]
MPRFVILRHQMSPNSVRPSHWDLMLEKEEYLMTWALPAIPENGEQLHALPLQKHRLCYLDYEGALTENRGVVTRHDWGSYKEISDEPEQYVIELQGQRLCGRATIGKRILHDEYVLFQFNPRTNDAT